MEYNERLSTAFNKLCPEGSLFNSHYSILKSVNGRCFGNENKPYHYNISCSNPYPGVKRVRVYPLTSRKSERIPKGYFLIEKGRIPQIGNEKDSLMPCFLDIRVAIGDLLNGELSEFKGIISKELLAEIKIVIRQK